MGVATIGLILLVAVLLQGSVIPVIPMFNVEPGLVLLAIVGWSFLRGAGETLAAAAIGGLLLGLSSSAPFGTDLLALVPVAFLLILAESSAVEKDLFFSLTATFVCTLIYQAVVLLILQSLGQPTAWLPSLLKVAVPSAVVNTLLMPFIFWLLQRVRDRLPVTAQEGW
ncbi:MAG: rod shape-determining protein MreD [Chloroflexi bacterium]|nr:rod shape-determining protein MreD [Chloroflexota bacterium]